MAVFAGLKEPDEESEVIYQRKPTQTSEYSKPVVEPDTGTFITAQKAANIIDEDLPADYFKIYFDRNSLLQQLVQMEEDNLFLINHV